MLCLWSIVFLFIFLFFLNYVNIHDIKFCVCISKPHTLVNKGLAQEMLGWVGLSQYLSALGHCQVAGQSEHDQKKIWGGTCRIAIELSTYTKEDTSLHDLSLLCITSPCHNQSFLVFPLTGLRAGQGFPQRNGRSINLKVLLEELGFQGETKSEPPWNHGTSTKDRL